MENGSTSQTSPSWPTRWPKGSFSFGWTFAFICLLAGAFFFAIFIAVIGAYAWLNLHGQSAGLAAYVSSRGTETNAPVFIAFETAQLAAEALAVVLILIALPRLTHISLREIGFRAISLRTIGYALTGAAAMVVIADAGASVILSHYPHAVHPQLAVKVFEAIKSQPGGLLFFVLFAAVLQPIAEEMIFRVFVFNLALRYGGFWVAAIISGGLFGAAHTLMGGTDDVSAALLAISGIALCWVYYRSRNAYASMISHGLFNAFSVALLYYAPKLAGS